MKHEVFQMDQVPAEPLAAPVEAGRIAAAKRSFAIRRIDLGLAAGLVAAGAKPRAGDLVLARVETLGQHKRLEEPGGRRATLFPGDEILVAYGDRYAPDQFEAHVPETLGPCELVAGGGIAARVVRKSSKVRGATGITPVGLVTDASGRRLNTRDFAMAEPSRTEIMPSVVAVVGSSMNAGKTTTISALVRGEASRRRRVAGVKVTGTGSGGDLWSYRDAGARLALDFTDAGHATTHRLTNAARERILEMLVARAAEEKMEIVFVEIADGLLFPETAELILSQTFRNMVDSVIFAAADAMGALAGIAWLERHGLPLRALSGAVTASPLAVAEIAGEIELPVVGPDEIAAGVLEFERVDPACAA